MADYILIPGAGGSSWYWHLVVERLSLLGHDVVAPDLPATDPAARLADYVDVVVDAIGAGREPIVVGQSMGALVAPIVCARVPARLLVLVAPMMPSPGESGGAWWAATGQPAAAAAAAAREGRDPGAAFDPVEVFLHDLDPALRAEAMRRLVEQADGPFLDPWPLATWPATPTRVIACRHDRLFPLPFVQALSRARLGIEPDIIDSGHLPALARPELLVEALERARSESARAGGQNGPG